jgi:hypothetical protein
MGYIKYMKPQAPLMPVIPAAGPLAAQAHSLFIVRSSGFKLCPSSTPAHAVAQAKPNGQGGLNKFGGDWLYAEDEYFPFDADSFEER